MHASTRSINMRKPFPIIFTKRNGERVIINIDNPYKSITVEEKSDNNLQINLNLSDPLEEEDYVDLVVI